MIWSPANSQTYEAARLRVTPNRTKSAYKPAMDEAKCTSDCVVKGGVNSGWCENECRFASPPQVAQLRNRAPLPKVYPPALDYEIPYANYGPYYNGYPVPTFPRAVRLLRGVASPQTSPINVPAPLDGIGIVGGESGCRKLPNGALQCPNDGFPHVPPPRTGGCWQLADGSWRCHPHDARVHREQPYFHDPNYRHRDRDDRRRRHRGSNVEN